MKLNSKIIDYVGWGFLIITISLLRFFESYLNNIIHAKSFYIKYAVYGTMVSILILFLIYKIKPEYYKEGGNERGSAVLSYFFGIIVLFLFTMAFYNTETGKNNVKEVKAIVVEKSKNIRYGTTYLKLKIDNKIEKCNPPKKEWQAININDTIVLWCT